MANILSYICYTGVLLWNLDLFQRWITLTFSRTPLQSAAKRWGAPSQSLIWRGRLFAQSLGALGFFWPTILQGHWGGIWGILFYIYHLEFYGSVEYYKRSKIVTLWVCNLGNSHQAEVCDTKAGAELLDIILMKVRLMTSFVVWFFYFYFLI